MRILGTVERLHEGLDYHLARHNLLAANLAHLDTPGFRPLDLDRPRSPAAERPFDLVLARTNEGHQGDGPLTPGVNPATEDRSRWRVVEDTNSTAGFDGNAVSVDREAVKIAANQIRYDALSTLTSSALSGLNWAANDGRNG